MCRLVASCQFKPVGRQLPPASRRPAKCLISHWQLLKPECLVQASGVPGPWSLPAFPGPRSQVPVPSPQSPPARRSPPGALNCSIPFPLALLTPTPHEYGALLRRTSFEDEGSRDWDHPSPPPKTPRALPGPHPPPQLVLPSTHQSSHPTTDIHGTPYCTYYTLRTNIHIPISPKTSYIGNRPSLRVCRISPK